MSVTSNPVEERQQAMLKPREGGARWAVAGCHSS